jgi:hypothetical protein
VRGASRDVNALAAVQFHAARHVVLHREGVDAGRVALEPARAESTQRVTHLTYAVRER